MKEESGCVSFMHLLYMFIIELTCKVGNKTGKILTYYVKYESYLFGTLAYSHRRFSFLPVCVTYSVLKRSGLDEFDTVKKEYVVCRKKS